MSRTKKNIKHKKRTKKLRGGNIEYYKHESLQFVNNFINFLKKTNKELHRDDVLLFLSYISGFVKIYGIDFNKDKLNLDTQNIKDIYTSPLSNILFFILNSISPDNSKDLKLNEIVFRRKQNEKDHLLCDNYPDIFPYKSDLTDDDLKNIYPEYFLEIKKNNPSMLKFNFKDTIFEIYLQAKLNRTICKSISNSRTNRTNKLKTLYLKSHKNENTIIHFENKDLSKCTVFNKDFKYKKEFVNPEDIKYIIGPCSFFEFEYNGRRFYIFGEQHNKLVDTNIKCSENQTEENTVLFVTLVKSLAKYYKENNIDRTIDLFLENSLQNFKEGDYEGLQISPDFLGSSDSFNSIVCNLYEFIENNLKFEKNNELKDKLRVQNVDIRNLYYNINDEISRNLFLQKDNINFENLKSKIKKIITESEIIKKQLSKIEDEGIKTIITDAILEQIDLSDFTSYKQIPKFINNIITKKYIELNSYLIGKLASSLMDIYAISRMFRDFDIDETEITPYFKGTATDIFYYCGVAHSEKLKNVINKIMSTYPDKIKINEKTINNCHGLGSHILHSIPIISRLSNPPSCLKLDISKTSMIPQNGTIIKISSNTTTI